MAETTMAVRWLALVAVLALAAGLTATSAPAARAQATPGTITVSTTQDRAEPEECESSGYSDCSLREAVLLANDTDGAVATIVLPEAATYWLTIPGADEDAGWSGDLDVHFDLTIIGQGAGQTVIDTDWAPLPIVAQNGGDAPDRILHVHGSGITLALQGLTLGNGAADEGYTHDGTYAECGINGSDRIDCNGGAIYLDQFGSDGGEPVADPQIDVEDDPTSLVTNDVEVRDSFAGYSGGGIAAVGYHVVLDLADTVIAGNTAWWDDDYYGPLADDAEVQSHGGGFGNGGGIHVDAEIATVTLANVDIGGEEEITDLHEPPAAANVVSGFGGGVHVAAHELELTATGTLVGGNVAHEAGGGLAVGFFGGRIIRVQDEDEALSSVALLGSRIDGNAAYQASGGTFQNVDVSFDDSTVVDNRAVGYKSTGGLLASGGSLALVDSTIDGNEGGGVGGVGATGTDVTVERSAIVGNLAEQEDDFIGIQEAGAQRAGFVFGGVGGIAVLGGEIAGAVGGDVVITDSTITGNEGEAVGGAAFGADQYYGYYAYGGDAGAAEEHPVYTLDVSGTTFSGNTATDWPSWSEAPHAGGLFIAGYDAAVTNSTVSGNVSQRHGAGVTFAQETDDGFLDLLHVTVNDNEAEGAAPAVDEPEDDGVGLHLQPYALDAEDEGTDSPVAVLTHSIVAGSAGGPNCGGWTDFFASGGSNVDDDGSCVGDEDAESGDVVDDPLLAILSDNGGETETHALQTDSPAIDLATGDGLERCPNTDQRGVERPQGDGCDAGAFEYVAMADLEVTKTAQPQEAEVGDEVVFTITVTNLGPDTATGVTVVDTLPGNVTFVDASATTGTCGEDAGTITCALGDLALGATVTAEVTVAADDTGAATNSAVANSDLPDPDETNNTDTATVSIIDPPLPDGVFRLFGDDRIETAIEVSQSQFGDGEANAIVLARSTAFPDALAGTPLAIYEGAPLLLTPASTLDARVEAEIQRALPAAGTVYLLGGEVALQPVVEQRLATLGYTTVRLWGPSRFETAVAIAEQIDDLIDVETLLIATGVNFADALAGGAASAQVAGAILLTAGSTMHPASQAFIDDHAGLDRFALGGPASTADPGATSISGETRFETAVAAAEEFFDEPVVAGLATGLRFPDALTGGAHVGRVGGPILLNPSTELHPAPRAYLEDNAASIATAYLYGGTGALSAQVEAEINTAIGAQ